MAEPLKVHPAALHATAAEIDNRADHFSAAHQVAYRRASEAVLGSGLSAAALPEMLGAWELDRVQSSEQFTEHAGRHRTAANAFAQADHGDADRIRVIGTAL